MNKADYGNKAVEYFDSGYNCAESVFKALCEAMGKEANSSVVSGFGGGVGRSDSICGALSGAVAALGLWVDRLGEGKGEGKERVYQLVGQMVREFRQEVGDVNCTGITGLNLSTEEGYAQFRAANRHATHCAPAVRKSVELALTLIQAE